MQILNTNYKWTKYQNIDYKKTQFYNNMNSKLQNYKKCTKLQKYEINRQNTKIGPIPKH